MPYDACYCFNPRGCFGLWGNTVLPLFIVSKAKLIFVSSLSVGDHVRQDSMDFSKEWEQDPANCRCADRLKPLERRKARQHQRCLAHSLVGTPNYIAPEVLLRTGKPV